MLSLDLRYGSFISSSLACNMGCKCCALFGRESYKGFLRHPWKIRSLICGFVSFWAFIFQFFSNDTIAIHQKTSTWCQYTILSYSPQKKIHCAKLPINPMFCFIFIIIFNGLDMGQILRLGYKQEKKREKKEEVQTQRALLGTGETHLWTRSN